MNLLGRYLNTIVAVKTVQYFLYGQLCQKRIANNDGKERNQLTVFVSFANMGTTPWSVITAKFSSSLAIFAIAAQTLANTSLSSDFSKLTINSRPPTKLRTISPASWKLWKKFLNQFAYFQNNFAFLISYTYYTAWFFFFLFFLNTIHVA